jgi:tRNA1(Val) A37 N6-methylase TrmN6
VQIAQPRRGFRYGSEAFWMVGRALLARPGARAALDLGTGSGIGAALLAARGVAAVGVDAWAAWAPLWEETVASSTFAAELSLRVCDVRAFHADAPFDVVVSNPPYFPAGTGPVAPDPWRAAARTEGGASLDDFVAAACRSVARDGVVVFVLPRARAPEAIRSFARHGRGPCGVVFVGDRRALVIAGDGAPEQPEVAAEGDEAASLWYAEATGAPRRADTGLDGLAGSRSSG